MNSLKKNMTEGLKFGIGLWAVVIGASYVIPAYKNYRDNINDINRFNRLNVKDCKEIDKDIYRKFLKQYKLRTDAHKHECVTKRNANNTPVYKNFTTDFFFNDDICFCLCCPLDTRILLFPKSPNLSDIEVIKVIDNTIFMISKKYDLEYMLSRDLRYEKVEHVRLFFKKYYKHQYNTPEELRHMRENGIYVFEKYADTLAKDCLEYEVEAEEAEEVNKAKL